jgi:hypothetical protein
LERKIEIGEKNLKTNSFLFSDIFVPNARIYSSTFAVTFEQIGLHQTQ